jgi:hypothetical protein
MHAVATDLTTLFDRTRPITETQRRTPTTVAEITPFPVSRRRDDDGDTAWARRAYAANGFGDF